jgi:hypothetical protein
MNPGPLFSLLNPIDLSIVGLILLIGILFIYYEDKYMPEDHSVIKTRFRIACLIVACGILWALNSDVLTLNNVLTKIGINVNVSDFHIFGKPIINELPKFQNMTIFVIGYILTNLLAQWQIYNTNDFSEKPNETPVDDISEKQNETLENDISEKQNETLADDFSEKPNETPVNDISEKQNETLADDFSEKQNETPVGENDSEYTNDDS